MKAYILMTTIPKSSNWNLHLAIPLPKTKMYRHNAVRFVCWAHAKEKIKLQVRKGQNWKENSNNIWLYQDEQDNISDYPDLTEKRMQNVLIIRLHGRTLWAALHCMEF